MTALTAKITAIAVAAALALTGGLAIKMAQGDDPALSAKKSSTSTVAAEALAKAALFAGPEAGLLLLSAHGGALVLDDGRVCLAGLRHAYARSAA